MNGSQRAVLWIGLILTALNLAMHWNVIRSVIFTGGSGTGPSPSGGNSDKGNAPATPSLPWFIPHWPGTDIPLVSQTTPAGNKAGNQTTVA